jgi:hypothetical protein
MLLARVAGITPIVSEPKRSSSWTRNREYPHSHVARNEPVEVPQKMNFWGVRLLIGKPLDVPHAAARFERAGNGLRIAFAYWERQREEVLQ